MKTPKENDDQEGPMACPICGWETPCRPTPEAADMRMSIHMGAGHTDDELKAHYAKVNEDYRGQNAKSAGTDASEKTL